MQTQQEESSAIKRLLFQTAVLLLWLILLDLLTSFLAPVWSAALWAIALVALAYRFHRLCVRFAGPVFRYDLIRTARRGHLMGHRFVYGMLLMVVLYLVFATWFPEVAQGYNLFESRSLPVKHCSRFAESFFWTFLSIQLALIILVTPAYTAGVIAEEKQRRTLEFLLATDLTNEEIVLGLLGARLANMMLLTLTSLPFFSFLQLVGGIDPNMVIAGFLLSLGLMTLIGTASVGLSARARSPLTATLDAYLQLLFLGVAYGVLMTLGGYVAAYGLHSIFALSPDRIFLLTTLLVCAFNLIITGAFLQHSIRWLRVKALAEERHPFEPLLARIPFLDAVEVETEQPLLPEHGYLENLVRKKEGLAPPGVSAAPERDVDRPLSEFGPLRRPLPEIKGDPLLWKEMNTAGIGRNSGLEDLGKLLMVGLVLLAAFFAVGAWMIEGQEPGAVHRTIQGVGTVVSCVAFFTMALLASGSVIREREQQTLDSLFTLPVHRDVLLFTKALACFLKGARFAWVVVPLWVMGVLTGNLHLAALPLLLGAWLVYAAFATSLGLWISVTQTSSMRATLFTVLAGFLAVTGPGCLVHLANGEGLFRPPSNAELTWQTLLADFGLTPPMTLWTFSWRSDEFTEPRGWPMLLRLLAGLVGVHIYLAATVVLWVSMHQRFHEDMGPKPRGQMP